MKRAIVAAVIVWLFSALPARAELITLNFNVFPGTFADAIDDDWRALQMPYATTAGVDISVGTLMDSYLARLYAGAGAASYAFNGSGVLLVSGFGTLITAGGPFTLQSVKLAPEGGWGGIGEQVRFTGMLGSRPVGHIDVVPVGFGNWLTLDGAGLGLVDAIAIAVVGGTDLNDELWLDDLTLHRVREPGVLLLIGVGFSGVLMVRRRVRS